jgi:hypothetical protein
MNFGRGTGPVRYTTVGFDFEHGTRLFFFSFANVAQGISLLRLIDSS